MQGFRVNGGRKYTCMTKTKSGGPMGCPPGSCACTCKESQGQLSEGASLQTFTMVEDGMERAWVAFL